MLAYRQGFSDASTKNDARSLDHETLTELCQRAVASVAEALGDYTCGNVQLFTLYRKDGWGALDAKKRGGRTPKLDLTAYVPQPSQRTFWAAASCGRQAT